MSSLTPDYKIKINLAIYEERNCTLFALGRNAMFAACRILNLSANDEVLTPAFDCDGSLQPFRVFGLKLRFFHSDPYTFSVDMDDIRRKISPRTKLIHIINHFGMPQPWNELLSLRKDTGIPILEDNAYSLFSKVNNRLFGTFGDISIFSLRKNLPLTDGGLLRINNPEFTLDFSQKRARWCYSTEYAQLLRLLSRKVGLPAFLRYGIKEIFPLREVPPPLYSESVNGYPDWPLRDVIGKEFSCDYLRPMSRLAQKQLSKFLQGDFNNIIEKKRYYYNWLSGQLRDVKGVKVLWPELPKGIAPFCLSLLVSSKRDIFLEVLRKKYEVMTWPTLPGVVLEQLKDFPEVEYLGRRSLQINLPAEKVARKDFLEYLKKLIKDINILFKKII